MNVRSVVALAGVVALLVVGSQLALLHEEDCSHLLDSSDVVLRFDNTIRTLMLTRTAAQLFTDGKKLLPDCFLAQLPEIDETLSRNHRRDPTYLHERCAVVGNSAILLSALYYFLATHSRSLQVSTTFSFFSLYHSYILLILCCVCGELRLCRRSGRMFTAPNSFLICLLFIARRFWIRPRN